MKLSRRNVLFCALLTMFGGRLLSAHHAFAPVYDGSRQITVKGVVTQFRFVNPHAMLLMDVTDDSGKTTKWTVEFAGRLNLSEGGWTADTIKAKERVAVTGNPTHINSNRMFFRKIVRADGTELFGPEEQRSKDIEEERRQRQRARTERK
jgi:hypothetical protein